MHIKKTYYLLILTFISSVVFANNTRVIDGQLNEPAWDDATILNDFVITEPFSKEIPEDKTIVKFYSDDEGINIAFINQQKNTSGQYYTTLKDEDIKGDYNEIIIDFDGDQIRSHGFKVGRSGSVQDSVWRDERREDIDWDGNWTAAVSHNENQWTSEIFIPWSITASKKSNLNLKKINIYLSRWHDKNNNRSSYPAVDRNKQIFISGFHPLSVEKNKSNMEVDLFPHFSTLGNIHKNETHYNTGIDVFWKITESQQVNVTINPDFGQVESNDLVLNFSSIETFFEEKRSFFRENHDVMDLQGPEGLILVHTPRIGAAPDLGDELSSGINGAIRYTDISNNFEFGALTASEDNSELADGRDFFAGRMLYKQQDWNAGILYTYVDSPTINRQAQVSVFDMEYTALTHTRLYGQVIHTSATADSHDGKTDGSKDTGWWIQAEYEPNDAWSNELVILDFGSQLQLNDFGYIKRTNRQQLEYETAYEWAELPDSKYLRDIVLGLGIEYRENEQGDDLPHQLTAAFETTTILGSQWSVEWEYQSEGVDDLLTRGRNPVLFPDSSFITLAYAPSRNSPFTYEAEATKGNMGINNSDFYQLAFTPTYQFGEFLNLETELEFTHQDSWTIWLENNDIGEFEMEELSIAVNLIAQFKERHEIRWKIESAFIQASAKNFYTALPGGNLQSIATGNDFSESEFSTQLRYRYKLSPLSDIFLVYARGGEYEDERSGHSNYELLSNSARKTTAETIFFKVKLHF
ncbi:DUF5916 domain-containing protein [Dasania marina]|uniref:DUF5916 domain-containing protein n=1 Tax=Dasania marina TaxID=471499 RepID=UPI0030DA9D09|tara:strand:- start:50374 stop:52626 length:2253 start_codon:yes stop_codon:yes gene_type:complete